MILSSLLKQREEGLLYKVDLRKAFRPSHYNLVPYTWKKHIYFDTGLSMSAKSSANCCQKVTNVISLSCFKFVF